MKATITQIELRTPFHFFKLSWHALEILKQLKKANHVDFKKTGFWTNHYTMTLWESEKDIDEFSRSGAHLHAMKESKKIAKRIKTITIDVEEKLPDWKKAKEILKSVEGTNY